MTLDPNQIRDKLAQAARLAGEACDEAEKYISDRWVVIALGEAADACSRSLREIDTRFARQLEEGAKRTHEREEELHRSYTEPALKAKRNRRSS